MTDSREISFVVDVVRTEDAVDPVAVAHGLPAVDHHLHDAQHPTTLAPALLTALHDWHRRASRQGRR